MHIQIPGPGWLDAAMKLPDNSLIKSVSDAGPLREAKLKWIALERDPKRLVTCYRHFGLEPSPVGATWAQAIAHWRVNFPKFIDATWRSKFAPYVDLVEDCNEYTAVSTWVDDPDHGTSKLVSMEAAAWVWNHDYRGQGTIPSTCKFTLMCGPVANWFPKEVFELSLKYDAPINYHAYWQCLNGARVANDFHDASGLWNNLESHYGLFPEYVFGEVMPYKSSAEGWRASGCLNANQEKLVATARAVIRDAHPTLAFKQNRILGKNSFGAWFTIGGGLQWKFYELESAQLNALAVMYGEEEETNVDTQLKLDINHHAQAIFNFTFLDGKLYPLTLPPQNKVIQFYHQNSTPFTPAKLFNVTWPMNVVSRSGNMLLVLDAAGVDNDLWMRVEDIVILS